MTFPVHIADWRGTRSIVFNPGKKRVRVEISTGCYGGDCDTCGQRLSEASSWLRRNCTAFTRGKMYPSGSEYCIGYSFRIDPKDRTKDSICKAIGHALGVSVFPR